MNTKYPDGYFPKIEYWTEQLVQAVRNEDLHEIDHCHNKLDYFLQKQFEWRNKSVIEAVASYSN